MLGTVNFGADPFFGILFITTQSEKKVCKSKKPGFFFFSFRRFFAAKNNFPKAIE
ncbi:hypothetical protein LEP1GSC062_0820 [Leptospira alexanderi serovar Manhao 3 str. L 60]|uniref:Uncharacterized protein n=1 Tax=Leptospira alexanderi serovar Manhao 3 str. L 60 TaxID=1049759 RepID=V6IFU9_9LEPT|nr:hypothetical protein LEP1GSC062_0820 [Leptospira alexanderi serovar Manhao 3 str. L 60]